MRVLSDSGHRERSPRLSVVEAGVGEQPGRAQNGGIGGGVSGLDQYVDRVPLRHARALFLFVELIPHLGDAMAQHPIREASRFGELRVTPPRVPPPRVNLTTESRPSNVVTFTLGP